MSVSGEREFLGYKLSFLKEKNQQLLVATRQEHVQCVLTTVQQWLDSTDGSESFATLNQKVENAILFVTAVNKAVEQCSGNESPASFSSTQLQPLETSVTVKAGAEARMDKLQASEQTGVPDSLNNLIGRICVIEEAFSSIKTLTDKITQNQNSGKENVRGLSDKQEQQAKKMEEIEKKVKQLMSKKSAGLKEINEKLSNQDNELSLLKGKQSEMKKQLDVVEKGWKIMEAEMDELSVDIGKAEEETKKQKEITEKQLDELKNEIEELSTFVDVRVDKISDEMDALTSSIDAKVEMALEGTKNTVVELSNKTEAMQTRLEDGSQQMDTPLKQLSDKMNAFESQATDITKKVEENSLSIKKQVQNRRKDRELLGKYIDRLVVVELQRVKDSEENTKNHEEVSEQLESLGELRNILNNKAKARDANVKRLDQLDVKVSSLTGKVVVLENREPTKTAGVQASIPKFTKVTKGDILKNYNVYLNTAGAMNAGTGQIVVPFDGLAVVGFSLQQSGEGGMNFFVKHNTSTRKDTVCCVRSLSHWDLRTSMGVCQVKQNDVLSVAVSEQSGEAELGWSRFSCLFIG